MLIHSYTCIHTCDDAAVITDTVTATAVSIFDFFEWILNTVRIYALLLSLSAVLYYASAAHVIVFAYGMLWVVCLLKHAIAILIVAT